MEAFVLHEKDADSSRNRLPIEDRSNELLEVFYSYTDLGSHEKIVIIRPKNFNNLSGLKFEMTGSDVLVNQIVDCFKGLDTVKRVFFRKSGDTLHIWTALAEYNDESKRLLVYHQEKALMGMLANQKHHFDFCIINVEDSDEILSSGASLIFDRVDKS
jgi:hypothetical protein